MVESIIQIIGNLVLPYVVLSIFALLLVELIAQLLRLRARILEHCIRHMVGDPHAKLVANALYGHPLIKSLATGGRKPAYIPSRLFALAFVDEIQRITKADEFAQAVDALPENGLRITLQALLRETDPVSKVVIVQRWFLGVMDQASGLYRWRTLVILALVAAALVTALNFDAIRISNYIAERSLVEKWLEARLDNATKRDSSVPSPAPLRTEDMTLLKSLAFPIGWSAERSAIQAAKHSGRVMEWVSLKIIGLFASILAVMIGAPFLFDTLNRFMVVRFTVKPYEPVNESVMVVAPPNVTERRRHSGKGLHHVKRNGLKLSDH